MIAKCAVLVSSCDKYEDAWAPFFHFFKKYWDKCPFPIFLNTETKSIKYPNLNVNVINFHKNGGSWSARLKHALKQIDTEYIIFLLEDFFFLDYVNVNEIDRSIRIMDKDRSIAVIDFEYCGAKIPCVETEYDEYVERTNSSMYFLNCQSAIWRRKDLIRLINEYENPWQFELFGTERAKLYKRRFFLQKNDFKVFNYIVDWYLGYGLHGGKWLKSNVDLFRKEGLSVDFSRMGFFEHNNVTTECIPPRKSLKWKIMFVLYGGFEQPRTSLSQQIVLLFRNPPLFLQALKKKFRFLISD